jgi:RNA polymerase sigma-70 factor (sigma-E family)
MLADVAAASGPEAIDVAPRADLRSFAEIFEEQRPRALRLAYGMTGDAALAEDVVAEAFARTYRQWVKGRVDDPSAYVRRAVVNEVRNTWRRLAVRRRHAATQHGREPVTIARDERVADADLLQRALAGLSPRVRAVVILRIVEDLSEVQTAETLGISTGAVKAYLSRGLDRLRETIAAKEGDSGA